MGRYDDLLYQLIKKNLRSFFQTPLNKELEAEIRKYPGLPIDYIDFLEEIGYGDIGDGYFVIYNSLIKPSDIYAPAMASRLRDIVFLGDDCNGHSIGFEYSGIWELIEVDKFQKITFLNVTFENFIRNKIASYLKFMDEYKIG